MEKVCIKRLEEINAYVRPSSRAVSLDREALEFEASVTILIRSRIRTVHDAVNSTLSQQTIFPSNAIMIDNHSTNGTAEAFQELSAGNRLMHIAPQENDLGIGDCQNAGVHHRKCGKFAVQLDNDDLYKDGHILRKIVDTFYQQDCMMAIGVYLMTDFQMNEIAPGVIDYKEWAVEDGLNNTLCINGLGVPRVSHTPIPHKIELPNTNHGGDYIIDLSVSHEYTIGCIYDVIYLCRRWEDNFDAVSGIGKTNRNNFYKDSIRAWESQTRIRMHSVDEGFQRLINEMIEKQKKGWKLTKKSYKELGQNFRKEKMLKLRLEGDTKRAGFFPNPQRAASVITRTDSWSIQERPCFLCDDDCPTEQTSLSLGHYEVCLNPYPIFRRRLTIIEEEYTPQAIKNHFKDMLFPAENMNKFPILHNGPECGASTPGYMYFQAAGKEGKIVNLFGMTFVSDMFSSEDSVYSYLENGFTTSIGTSSPNRRGIIEMFEYLYNKVVSIYHDKKPLTNVIAWYGLETVNRAGSDEIKQQNCITFLRSKHRSERYYAQRKKGLLISLATAEMCGVFPIAREGDLDKVTAKKIIQICKEVSLSREQLKAFTDQTSQ